MTHKRIVYRNSITGQFCSKAYAKAHKATTQRHVVICTQTRNRHTGQWNPRPNAHRRTRKP